MKKLARGVEALEREGEDEESGSQKPSAVLGVFDSTYFYRATKTFLGIKRKIMPFQPLNTIPISLVGILT